MNGQASKCEAERQTTWGKVRDELKTLYDLALWLQNSSRMINNQILLPMPKDSKECQEKEKAHEPSQSVFAYILEALNAIRTELLEARDYLQAIEKEL